MAPADDYRRALDRAHAHALAYLDLLDTAPVSATASAELLRSRLRKPLPHTGEPPEQIVDELVAGVSGGLLGTTMGRFFAWVIGGSLPSTVAAEWMVSTWDQNAGMFAVAPAMAITEEVVGEWLLDLLGLPRHSSFALVTGCQMANTTCLAAARHHVLARQGWDVQKRGLTGAPRVHMLTNPELHSTMDRSLRLLGLGTDCKVMLEVDAQTRVRRESLARELEARRGEPMIVHLLAGEINTGAFDLFEQLIPLAHEHGAWVHVDGAFGLWAQSAPSLRHLSRGVEKADSWATDAHKWLNVPYDSGLAFVAHPDSHRASMTQTASYLVHSSDVRDQLDYVPEFSRRARGPAIYAALRELGRDGVVDLVERCCRHARELVVQIGQLPGAEAVFVPTLNQGLVRFVETRAGAVEADHARRTNLVIDRIVADGEVFFRGVDWHGKRCMRVSVSNWRTNESDVARAVAAVKRALS